MSQKLSQIFKSIGEIDPPFNLEGFILAKIERESHKIIREKKALAYAGLFGSALATVYAISIFGQEILQSDFWRIATLAFSDISIVAGNWHDYLFSLLETFPAIHAAIMLAPIFILLIALNAYLNLINKNNCKHCKHI
jgi:ABC-type phosphate/phosphonate transport system permease subunit